MTERARRIVGHGSDSVTGEPLFAVLFGHSQVKEEKWCFAHPRFVHFDTANFNELVTIYLKGTGGSIAKMKEERILKIVSLKRNGILKKLLLPRAICRAPKSERTRKRKRSFAIKPNAVNLQAASNKNQPVTVPTNQSKHHSRSQLLRRNLKNNFTSSHKGI